MEENSSDPLAEIEAMRKVTDALTGLNIDATRRVLRWATDHYGIKVESSSSGRQDGRGFAEEVRNPNSGSGQFISEPVDLAELYSLLQPGTDSDKVLVVSYWIQIKKGEPDIDAQDVNNQLKQLGYGVGNITRAFENLLKRKPQPIIQIRKSGTSQQARKKFKLTNEGKRIIEELLRNASS